MLEHEYSDDFCEDDIHLWFGLSYSNYLTIPRSILQSMPARWQHEFAKLLGEATDMYSGYDMEYSVYKRDDKGKFVHDELADYQRGRRFIKPISFEDKINNKLNGGK